MRSRTQHHFEPLILAFTLSVVLLTASSSAVAANFGAPSNAPLQSDATICMSVGAQASLTELEDFTLRPVSGDGSAGALYEGVDQFRLDSNAPVRVIIEGEMMSNGVNTIDTFYQIDGARDYFDTASEGIHSSSHTLSARAQLGRISQQLAGDYSATLVLTVTPQIGGAGGCGEFTSQLNTIDGWSTLAFEDLYPRKGDGDYNDMVVKYHVQENYNPQNQLIPFTEKISFM